ncbi:MAG: hypothetical protein ABWZ02_09565 [Nakamurella sp.]
METPHSLTEDLDTLTDALDDPVLDIEAVLNVLTDDLSVAIPSYLGLSITLQIDGNPCRLNSSAASSALRAMSSLWLPLAPRDVNRPGGQVVFYARDPGAFVDIAEDARWMFMADGQAVIDRHLTVASGIGADGIHGLAELGEINQAVGVLSAMGHTAAKEELLGQALGADRSVLQTARDILSSIVVSSAGGG